MGFEFEEIRKMIKLIPISKLLSPISKLLSDKTYFLFGLTKLSAG